MATPHNAAERGDFAKTVLMPGDPLRAKFIADTFLDNVKEVTSVRNCLGFTGTYKGVPVSVMASGMGMPSIGIYSYELYTMYDVENIIRIGSAGAYSEELKVLDVCLGSKAYSDSTFAELQCGEKSHTLYPTESINKLIKEKAEELGITCKDAVIHSSDVFYSDPKMGSWEDIRDRTKTDCVEMESFALFSNAKSLNKGAACLLTISDSFVTHQEIDAEKRQTSFTDMMKIALETAIAL